VGAKGSSAQIPLSGSSDGEDSITVEGAVGCKPLRKRGLEPTEKRSRLRIATTLRSSCAPRDVLIAVVRQLPIRIRWGKPLHPDGREPSPPRTRL
jgi:hypothetical protein